MSESMRLAEQLSIKFFADHQLTPRQLEADDVGKLLTRVGPTDRGNISFQWLGLNPKKFHGSTCRLVSFRPLKVSHDSNFLDQLVESDLFSSDDDDKWIVFPDQVAFDRLTNDPATEAEFQRYYEKHWNTGADGRSFFKLGLLRTNDWYVPCPDEEYEKLLDRPPSLAEIMFSK